MPAFPWHYQVFIRFDVSYLVVKVYFCFPHTKIFAKNPKQLEHRVANMELFKFIITALRTEKTAISVFILEDGVME